MKAECVILAAGLSSRMGKNKMLLEIAGKTVIERCINAFYESCSKIIVVTGKYHEDIKQYLMPYTKVNLVYNEDYRQGMFSSVKAGIKHVEAERFFITPGDYPLLKTDTIRHMLKTTGNYVVPVYQGEQGHPVLLDKRFIPVILASTLNSLRDCLESFSSEKQKLSVDDNGIMTDIDTMQEYNTISKGF